MGRNFADKDWWDIDNLLEDSVREHFTEEPLFETKEECYNIFTPEVNIHIGGTQKEIEIKNRFFELETHCETLQA